MKKIIKAVIVILAAIIIGAAESYVFISIQTQSNPTYPCINSQNYSYQVNLPQSGQRVVCIVFDDGWQSQYTAAVPIMDQYGFKATFAIITQSCDNTNYMTWDEVITLEKNGHDIESHSYSHQNLNKLSTSKITFQLSQSKQDLLDHGINAPIFIYPKGGGAGNDTVEALVQQYYLLGRGIESGSLNLSLPFDRYNLPAYTISNNTSINDFINYVNQAGGSTIVILYYHKINYENVNTATTPENFAAEMQYLKDNNFTVETLRDIFTISS